MASGGNTWCKKLMVKRQKQIAKERYGSMVPLAERIRKAKLHNARVLDEIEKLPDEAPKTSKPSDAPKFLAPRREGFVVRGFGKRIAAKDPGNATGTLSLRV